MLRPSLPAKIQISDTGKKSDWHLLGSLMPLVSFFVWVFRHQKSMQKRKLLSVFLTNMTALHQAL